MIEKQRKAQADAFAKHKVQVEEEEQKRAEVAEKLDNDREARINIKELAKDAEVDIDDI
jgi:hypothetical protein